MVFREFPETNFTIVARETGPTPEKIVERVEKTEANRSTPKLEESSAQQTYLETAGVGIRPTVKLTEVQRAQFNRWLGEMQKWVQLRGAGRKAGRRPPTPQFMKKSNLGVFRVQQIIEQNFGNEKSVLNKVAAKIAGHETQIADMLRDPDPAVVATGINLMVEGKFMPDAKQEINAAPRRSKRGRKAERGFGVFGTREKGSPKDIPELSPTKTFVEGEAIKADILEAVHASLPPSNAGGMKDFMAGNGIRFHAPNIHMDKLRQISPVVRKMIEAPYIDGLVSLIDGRRHSHHVREGTVITWIAERFVKPYNKYLDSLRDPAKRVEAVQRLLKLQEGKLDVTDMNPHEARALNAMNEFFSNYRDYLIETGHKVRKDYFPHMREILNEIYIEPEAKLTISKITSSFTKRRALGGTKNVRGFKGDINEVHQVLELYAKSLERMIAWKPVEQVINGIKEFYGVEGSQTFKGSPEARKAGHQKMPAAQAEWWDAQIDIWNGRPGKLSKALENLAGATVAKALSKIPGSKNLLGRELAGKDIAHGWITLNYIGALGLSPAAAFKNMTQNVNTFTRVGPVAFTRGVYEFITKRSKGDHEFNSLLTDIGWTDTTFVKSLGEVVRTGVRGRFDTGWSALNKTVFFLFEKAELFNRGVAAIAGYRQAEAALRKQGGLTATEIHNRSILHGRDVMRSTQFDYDKMLGGQAFSGSAGRLIGQFGRFSVNQLDFLQLMVRRGLGSEAAKRQAPLLPGESGLFSLISAIASPFALNAGLNLMGLSLDDVQGPGAGLPDVVKLAGRTGIETTAGILTGKRVEVTQETDPDTGLAVTRPVGRGISRALGLEVFGNSPWETMFSSLGPSMNQARSLAQFMFMRDKGSKEELEKAFRIMYPTVQGSRVLKFLQAERDGFFRSRRTGKRIFPQDRNLTRHEKILALLGLESRSLDQEMELLSDSVEVDRIMNDMISQLRQESINRLIDGTTEEEVLAGILQGMSEIQDQTSQTFTMGDVWNEFNHIRRQVREGETKTIRQTLESRKRFSRFQR
jgi:hypothetical protein